MQGKDEHYIVKKSLVSLLGHPNKMFRFPLPDRSIFFESKK